MANNFITDDWLKTATARKIAASKTSQYGVGYLTKLMAQVLPEPVGIHIVPPPVMQGDGLFARDLLNTNVVPAAQEPKITTVSSCPNIWIDSEYTYRHPGYVEDYSFMTISSPVIRAKSLVRYNGSAVKPLHITEEPERLLDELFNVDKLSENAVAYLTLFKLRGQRPRQLPWFHISEPGTWINNFMQQELDSQMKSAMAFGDTFMYQTGVDPAVPEKDLTVATLKNRYYETLARYGPHAPMTFKPHMLITPTVV